MTELRGHPIPPLLRELTRAPALVEAWAALDLELDLSAHEMIDSLPSPTAKQLLPFAIDRGHQFFVIWPLGPSPEESPVVFVDNEGGVSSAVIASNVREFFAIALVRGPHVARYVDSVFNAFESPERAATIPPFLDLDDEVRRDTVEETWPALLSHSTAPGEAVPPSLVAAMARLGVEACPDVLAAVRGARAKWPAFRLERA